jgi:hypothetical protein
MRRVELVAMAIAFGILGGLAAAAALFAIGAWTLEDVDAYWNAALRLRAGEPLYPRFADVNADEVYRYAPWFAAAWVPLTLLPRPAVEAGWAILLVAASIWAVVPVGRGGTPAGYALALLVGPLLVFSVARAGNVHPLVVAALVHGAPRASGPLWIALAASLKAVPLVYVVVYVARRDWRRVILTLVLTAILTAPMLLFDLSGYTTDPGRSIALSSVDVVLWGALAASALLIAAWIALQRPTYAWLAASVAAVALLPRLFLYDLSYLLVGAANRRASTSPGPDRPVAWRRWRGHAPRPDPRSATSPSTTRGST